MTCWLLCRRWTTFIAKELTLAYPKRTPVRLASNSVGMFITNQSTLSQSITHRCFSDKSEQSTSDLHSLYLDQMDEINADRDAVFGPSDPALESQDISHLAKIYAENETSPGPHQTNQTPSRWNAEEAYAEREALFQFTSEEKTAWANHSSSSHPLQMSQQKLLLIKEALAQREREEHAKQHEPFSQQIPTEFTHLNLEQNGVSMVDIGNKVTTRRIAKARSVVVFPPDVMTAFQLTNGDMIGPKGPIFETARLAGIIGAKKTSDLIPLCHPLPLDRVHIDIQLVDNRAIIECECRVTHKTGVEMEALTGASIAALTIYDMVKAVSHNVEIGQTVLVSKSGGKSDFVQN